MKINYSIFVFVFVLISGLSNAQSTSNWKGLYLGSPDGTNALNGIEVYYTITTCNSNDVILLSMTNHNAYTVKAGWQDFVMSTANNKLSSTTVQDSVTILPKTTLAGDCTNNTVQLVLKLTDFGILKEDFKEFMVSKFDFIILH